MKLLCWNIRGFGLTGRWRQLIEYLQHEEIDIVGLHETIRQDFGMHELQRLSRHQFAWQWLPATGHSRGILLGVKEDAFSVEDMDRGEFFMSMSITDRRVHLSWEVIIVYVSADHGLSADFLGKLKNKVRRYAIEASLLSIYQSEELFWQRHAGHNSLLKGDANTAYFQAIANGRGQKCAIPFLWDGDVLLESSDDISTHIYSFYKELFSAGPRGGISLCADFWPLEAQVSDAENAELTQPFSPEEVGTAIASMKACSAPRPDGLPVVFFQRFSEILRPVVMPMFHEFYIGTLDMAWINFGVIAHIPKVVGASDIRKFRPITVINVLARIFSKAGDGRPKYHMVKWADIYLPKDQGGLGIPASRRMNVALMLRWVWRILRGDGGMWLQLLESKYM
ncbi:putative NOT transcription complex subunit VIP2 [Hordeum vulgare]|nr:putative NOT transcription complex subunit VIP2 [Hordeum vulgare]